MKNYNFNYVNCMKKLNFLRMLFNKIKIALTFGIPFEI